MDRLEYTSVPRWHHTSTALEEAPKERGVLVADREANLVNGLIRRFQLVLGFFDAKVLHVVNECEARGLVEASLQCALGNVRVADGNPVAAAEPLATSADHVHPEWRRSRLGPRERLPDIPLR